MTRAYSATPPVAVTAWFAWFPPASSQLNVQQITGMQRPTARDGSPARPVALSEPSPVDGSTTLHGTQHMPTRRHALTVLKNDVEQQMWRAKAKYEEMKQRSAVVNRALADVSVFDEEWK